MSFKQEFEKNLNKELEADDRDSRAYPPPPPIDIEMQQGPPPAQVFPSYPPPPRRRSGMYVPTCLFALFFIVFLFESGVLFIYTVVALWNTTGPAHVPPPPSACNCPVAAPMIVYPNGGALPSASVVTYTEHHDVTITVTPSVSATPTPSKPSSSGDGDSDSTSSSASTSSVAATDSAVEALLSAFAGKDQSSGIVTVTAPVPTSTVTSTASAELPSITTMTVLSTAPAPVAGTVTSTAVVTASSA